MASRKAKAGAKRVVYLIGAGATQAEISFLGAKPVNILVRDSDSLGEGISTGIINSLNRPELSGYAKGADIEKLISLFGSAGTKKLARLAEKMRGRYFTELRNRLVDAEIIDTPRLLFALLEMHRNIHFSTNVEDLRGVITTNHDGLAQLAASEVFGSVNLGFPFASSDYSMGSGEQSPLLLQLHGSFTWNFGVPLRISRLRKDSAYSADTVWIPPSILKEGKVYPFNKISGMAYELLSGQCDVLRIVGASLTQNDWNVQSQLFNAQQHLDEDGAGAFQIELIMHQDVGQKLREQCSYLQNMLPIGSLTDGEFGRYKDPDEAGSVDLNNPFAFWLTEKIRFHSAKGDFGPEPIADTMKQLLDGAS